MAQNPPPPNPPQQPNSSSGSSKWGPWVPYILFGLIVFIFIALIIWVVWNSKGGFLESLERVEYARGLITFLIAVATVAIALILALSTVVGGGTV